MRRTVLRDRVPIQISGLAPRQRIARYVIAIAVTNRRAIDSPSLHLVSRGPVTITRTDPEVSGSLRAQATTSSTSVAESQTKHGTSKLRAVFNVAVIAVYLSACRA